MRDAGCWMLDVGCWMELLGTVPMARLQNPVSRIENPASRIEHPAFPKKFVNKGYILVLFVSNRIEALVIGLKRRVLKGSVQ